MTHHHYGIVFPGQGSQSVGMLADVAAQYDEVKQTFDLAEDVLGYDLWALVQHGPVESLDQTTHTQPALLAASYAVWQIMQSRFELNPLLLAGHSLGEYTALVCAGALSFADALKLVAARGQYMQSAVPPGVGAMAAIIGLDETVVISICKQITATSTNEIVTPANFNSIGQVVIAGHQALVQQALVLAKEQGAKLTVLIPVSVPSHCQLMLPAAERMAALLSTVQFTQPRMTVISNVDASAYTSAESIRGGLVRQLTMPVRWIETIQLFTKSGIAQVIECGPGKVLTGLNKRIDKTLQLMTTSDLANLEALNVA